MNKKSKKWIITYELDIDNETILKDLNKISENVCYMAFNGHHLFVKLKTHWHLEDMEKVFPKAFTINVISGDIVSIVSYVFNS